jgi:flagellin-like hook-associated protein FlgL
MSSDNAIFNIMQAQSRLNKINEQLATEQAINRPSDDPVSTRQIMEINRQLDSNNQYLSNIKNGQTWTNVANTTLQAMSSSISQAKSTVSTIIGGLNDPGLVSNSLSLLDNVRRLLIDMGNVQVGNQYVFGGFNNAAPVITNKALDGVVNVSKPANQIKLSGPTGIAATAGTAGLIVGMTVSGNGILPDTTITKIDTTTNIVTLSKNPNVTGSALSITFGLPPTTQKGNTSLNSTQNQITGINTFGLSAGDPVTGPGVLLGTTIASIDNASQITLSQPLSQATTGGTFNFAPRILKAGGLASAATVIDLPNTTGIGVGSAITGPGIPSGTTVVGVNVPGANQVTISQPANLPSSGTYAFTPTIIQSGNVDVVPGLDVISGLDTTNLVGGDTVTGPGLPPGGTTIASIGPAAGQVTLTTPLSQAVSGGVFTFTHVADAPVASQTGNTSFTSTQITGLDTTNLNVGMTVTGPGVPSGTTIISKDSASQITLSQPLTQATTGGSFTFLPTVTKTVNNATPSTSAAVNQIAGLPDVTGLSIGMSISGPGIPANTSIISIDQTNPAAPVVVMNNFATQTANGGSFVFGPAVTKVGATDPPNQITGLAIAQTQNLYVGMKVSGPGVPDNTTITAVDATGATGVVTLSNTPTGAGGAGQFVFEGYIDSYGSRTVNGNVTNGSTTVSGLPSTANMINAPTVTKTGATDPFVNLNQITGIADMTGLYLGMGVSEQTGLIIPPDTTITAIDPVTKTITLSNSPSAAGTGISFIFDQTIAKTATPLPGLNQLTGLPETGGLSVGMPVSGAGIPANTVITAINPVTKVVTLNNTPLAGPATKYVFGSNKNMTVSGTGIQLLPPTTAVSINSATDITLSAAATSSGTSVPITLTGYFSGEDVSVGINKTAQVALNYSGAKLLLGGSPASLSQKAVPPSELPVNILSVIGELMTAIQNKDDKAILAGVSNLQAAGDQITRVQNEYVNRSMRLDNAETMINSHQDTLKNTLASKQNVDTAKAIIELQQQTTAYQAALQATAKIMPMSLLDYLR